MNTIAASKYETAASSSRHNLLTVFSVRRGSRYDRETKCYPLPYTQKRQVFEQIIQSSDIQAI